MPILNTINPEDVPMPAYYQTEMGRIVQANKFMHAAVVKGTLHYRSVSEEEMMEEETAPSEEESSVDVKKKRGRPAKEKTAEETE